MRPQKEFHKALAFLNDAIADAQRAHSSRLPTCKHLAMTAAVSYPTMLKAVRTVEDQGIITVNPRIGIKIVSPFEGNRKQTGASAAYHQPALLCKWELAKVRIQSDILAGIFTDNVLFPRKELCFRYNVSMNTLRKVLDALVKEQRIRPDKRGFRVRFETHFRHHRGALLMVLPGTNTGMDVSLTMRMENLAVVLERECSRYNLQIVPYFFNEMFNQAKLRAFEKIVRSPSIDAVMLWEVYSPHMIEVVWRAHKPSSLLEDGDSRPSIEPLLRFSGTRMKIFPMGYTPLCGKIAGRYLLDMGHREIAFISFSPEAGWPVNRLSGFQSAFREHGITTPIRDVRIQMPDIDEMVFPRNDPLTDSIRERIGTKYSSLFEGSSDELKRTINRINQYEYYIEHAENELMKLVECKKITAWVGDNDITALTCLFFLRHNNIPVPDSISVLGFDNSRNSFLQRLTTYDFNLETYVRAMLAHIMQKPDSHKRKENLFADEIEGSMIERDTVKRLA